MFNWLRNLFIKDKHKTEIWSVIKGPIFASDLSEEELDELDVPDTAVRLDLKIAIDGEVFDIEAWFEDYENAKPIVDHFRKFIEPLPLNLKDYRVYV
jgi:NifB/MoaA-like Fe-S oxidoreductase